MKMRIFTKAMVTAAMTATVATAAAFDAPVKRAPGAPEADYKAVPKKAEGYPGETWHDIGTGILRDDVITFIYMVDNVEFPVHVQESDQRPGRYRLLNAWKNYPVNLGGPAYPEDRIVPLVIDATDPDHVAIECGYMGIYTGPPAYGDEGYQEGVLWSMLADFRYENSGGFSVDDLERISGKLRDEAITFPKGSILFQAWEPALVDEDGNPQLFSIWNTVNHSGMFRLKLPGAPNVDMTATLVGLSEDGKSVEYDITMQEDVNKIRAYHMEGEDGFLIEDVLGKIKSGEVEYIEIPAQDGRYSFAYEGDGTYTLILVPYTDDDVARYETYVTNTYSYDESEWKKVEGKAKYTEAILASNEMNKWGFTLDPQTYEVDVEVNVEEPQIFRLVNAYGPPYMYANSQNYDSSHNYYIVFDATDADRVLLERTYDFIGLEISSYKSMAIWSKAARLRENEDMSLDEINQWEKENDTKVFGRVDENNVVTFPRESLLLNFAFIRPDTWYWSNNNGSFRLELPKEMAFVNRSSVDTLISDSDSNMPAEYYTLDGMKVSSDNLIPGIYVVRQGSKVWKEVVK